MVKTYCCNPFELHTKRVTTRLRVVSEEFVESGLVQSGEAVCSNCATSLRTQKTVEDFKKNHPERFEIGGTPSQTSESTQATDTHSQETIDSDLDEEIASERLKCLKKWLKSVLQCDARVFFHRTDTEEWKAIGQLARC